MRIDFGSISEKQVQDVRPAGMGGVKERRPVLCVATIEIRPGPYQAFNLGQIATLNRSNQFDVRCSHV